jgi:hypothetical protein
MKKKAARSAKKYLAEKKLALYLHSEIEKSRSVGQGVKTPPFHGGITGSIPVRSTTESVALQRFPHFTRVSRTEFATFHGQIAIFYNANK